MPHVATTISCWRIFVDPPRPVHLYSIPQKASSIIDAGEFDRASKISAMRDWDEFLRHLRVCWEGPQKDRNCCACEKCIRNILMFRALGLKLPPCFPIDVDEKKLLSVHPGSQALSNCKYGGLAHLAATNAVTGAMSKVRLLPVQER